MQNQTVFEKAPGVVARKMAEQMVLVPVTKGVGDMENIFSLNDVGTSIWEAIDGVNSLADICAKLDDEFDADSETIRSDAEEFIAQLQQNNLVSSK